jgi:hypothetical protein
MADAEERKKMKRAKMGLTEEQLQEIREVVPLQILVLRAAVHKSCIPTIVSAGTKRCPARCRCMACRSP